MSTTDNLNQTFPMVKTPQEELQQALQKISFLKMEQDHLRECLKTALDSLKVRSDAVHQLHEELRKERQAYSRTKGQGNGESSGNEEQALKLRGQLETMKFEIETLQDQLQTLKRQNADLESNNLTLCESYKITKDQLVTARNEISNISKHYEKISSEQKHSREQALQNYSSLQDEYTEKMQASHQELEETVTQFENQIEQLRGRLDESQFAYEALKEESRLSTQEKIEHITLVFEEKFAYQRAQFEIELQELERRVNSLESDNQNLSQQMRNADDAVWNLERENEGLTSRAQIIAAEKAKAEEKVTSLIEDLELADQRQKRINELVIDQNQEIDRLNSVNLQLTGSLREKDLEISNLTQKIEAQHEEQNQILKQKNEIAWELDHLRLNERKWKSEVEDLNRTVQDLQSKLGTRQADDEIRNRQYRFYIDNLNRNKKELRDQCLKLVQELKATAKMNPMRDLLTATGREISRVELQLKRTPTISADRSRLEQGLAELIEQRDFLTQALESSTSEMREKIQRISEIIDGDVTTMAPPPPPSPQES